MYEIMIVDDEMLVRSALKGMLDWESEGFTFIADASNGEEALSVLDEFPTVDIILLDIYMPVMDGIRFLQKIQDRKRLPAIIVLSANNNFLAVREAFKLGITDYLLKSEIDEQTLLAELQKVSRTITKVQDSTAHGNLQDQRMLKILIEDTLYGRNTQLSIQLLEDTDHPLPLPCVIILFWFTDEVETQQLQMILQQAQQYLQEQARGYVQLLQNGQLIFFIAADPDEHYLAEIDAFSRDLQDQLRISMNIYASFAVSALCAGLPDIPQQFTLTHRVVHSESRIIRRAKQFIQKAYARSDLSLEDVSEHVEVSRTYLSAHFKKECGITFWEYVTLKRIEAAKQLIDETNLKMYEIADKVGYQNVEHFSRVFKKVTSTSPRSYSSRIRP
ncbi:MAG: response regulator [Spirochaetia bacterium]|nr:response regulator [Spirochaetia bacterium]MCF7942264.1 response regulator [Spirochaetia bacterium]